MRLGVDDLFDDGEQVEGAAREAVNPCHRYIISAEPPTPSCGVALTTHQTGLSNRRFPYSLPARSTRSPGVSEYGVASKVGSARPGYPVANQYGDLIRSPASVNPVSKREPGFDNLGQHGCTLRWRRDLGNSVAGRGKRAALHRGRQSRTRFLWRCADGQQPVHRRDDCARRQKSRGLNIGVLFGYC